MYNFWDIPTCNNVSLFNKLHLIAIGEANINLCTLSDKLNIFCCWWAPAILVKCCGDVSCRYMILSNGSNKAWPEWYTLRTWGMQSEDWYALNQADLNTWGPRKLVGLINCSWLCQNKWLLIVYWTKVEQFSYKNINLQISFVKRSGPQCVKHNTFWLIFPYQCPHSINTIIHARDLFTLAWSCKQWRLWCPPVPCKFIGYYFTQWISKLLRTLHTKCTFIWSKGLANIWNERKTQK